MVSCRPEKTLSNPLCFALTWFILAGFACQTRGDDTNHFARWEKEIAAFAKSDGENPPPKKGIVFVGSSSLRLRDLKKSFPGIPVINRGFGGSHLADAVHFARALVIKHQPRLVVFYAGENDIAAGASPARVAVISANS
jgi:lysophospholipase L1-like esterase